MPTFKDEIQKIIEFKNTTLNETERKKDEEINQLIEDTVNAYNTDSFDFSSYYSYKIKQNGKKREIAQFLPWTVESFLCIYIKRVLDREFRIKYQNRNDQIKLLFDSISSIQNMNDFTIVRFDFENFFNSISSEYVYLKYISDSNLMREEKEILKKYCNECDYCLAGLNTSNVMAEIISSRFDSEIKQIFSDRGLMIYKRYVDDGILIFNRYIDKFECKRILENCIEKIFKDKLIEVNHKCITKLNEGELKFNYISKRLLDNNHSTEFLFNFLGYSFILKSTDKGKINIKYGITKTKIDKYQKKIEKIINEFQKDNNMELLRHKLRAYCNRVVYRRKRYSKKVWKEKGFLSNYNELRYHLDQLDAATESFLKNGVNQAFRSLGIKDLPYFLKGKKEESVYSLFYNLKKNRTLLFEENEKIGINFETLKKMCQQLNISIASSKTYNSLLREYLIKIRVGH